MSEPGGGILLVGNARSRAGRRGVREALAVLRSGGLAPEQILESRTPAQLRSGLEKALKRGCRSIIAAGGDGTVRLVAAVVAGTEATLGILPQGTGNDFARTMGIPLDASEAARVIASGRKREVDLGLVNGRVFINAASLGLSAEVAHHVTRAQKARLGPLAYPLTAARLLFSHRPFRVRFSGDIDFVGWTHQIVVANGRFQGGGTPTLDEADPESGRLAVYVVEGRSRVTLFLVGLLVRFGQHTSLPPTQTFQGMRFEIETDRRRRINADGEELGWTPASFSLRRKALRIFAPDPEAGEVKESESRSAF